METLRAFLELIIEEEVLPTTYRPSISTSTSTSPKSWFTSTAQSPMDILLSRIEEGFGCPAVTIQLKN